MPSSGSIHHVKSEDLFNFPDSSAFIDILGVSSNKYCFIFFSTYKSTLCQRSPFLPLDEIV